jgi:2-amino-4-hydroxy-6-hydroxymethyldihydropteridine diphosphokinase
MNTIYLLLGSNMGNSKAIFEQAYIYIKNDLGIILNKSSLYATAAWGYKDQPDFLNQILIIQSNYNAETVLKTILSIEKKIGRVRTFKNAPRVIDIDIIFFNNEIIKLKHLTVPHVQIANRRFVLTPLCELSPNLIHPSLNKTVKELLFECKDDLNVQKI